MTPIYRATHFLGFLLPTLAFFLAGQVAESVEHRVGAFSDANPGDALPAGWRVAKLPGVAATTFSLTRLDGVTVVRMAATNAGASLYRPYRIDPGETPVLRWRWRIGGLIPDADLRAKAGDDVPARLYVMFDYPLEKLPFVERTKIRLARTVAGDLVPAAALCYVWDGKLPEDTSLWNAYTDRVRVVVAESGPAGVGQWVNEQRDVAEDFRAAFGEEPPPISGIAIAADTDQTGGAAQGWFGDISFSAR